MIPGRKNSVRKSFRGDLSADLISLDCELRQQENHNPNILRMKSPAILMAKKHIMKPTAKTSTVAPFLPHRKKQFLKRNDPVTFSVSISDGKSSFLAINQSESMFQLNSPKSATNCTSQICSNAPLPFNKGDYDRSVSPHFDPDIFDHFSLDNDPYKPYTSNNFSRPPEHERDLPISLNHRIVDYKPDLRMRFPIGSKVIFEPGEIRSADEDIIISDSREETQNEIEDSSSSEEIGSASCYSVPRGKIHYFLSILKQMPLLLIILISYLNFPWTDSLEDGN